MIKKKDSPLISSGRYMALASMLCAMPLASHTACWRASRLDPPDLSTSQKVVETELERQRAVLAIMQRDLALLRTLTEELLAYPSSSYARPFPLQTFTLTIVSCFNEPIATPEEIIEAAHDGEQSEAEESLEESFELPETPAEAAARRFDVTCLPASLPVLERKLDALVESGAPSAAQIYALGRAQLGRVESIRVLRHRLHTRQTALRPLLLEAKETLELQRSMWRQLATGVDSRRLDYTPANLAIARTRVQGQKKRLDELEEAIEALETSSKDWPDEVASMLDSLVYDLAWIGRS